MAIPTRDEVYAEFTKDFNELSSVDDLEKQIVLKEEEITVIRGERDALELQKNNVSGVSYNVSKLLIDSIG